MIFAITKIDFVAQELQVFWQTASRYLETLVSVGIVQKYKRAQDNYYLNAALFDLLHGAGECLSKNGNDHV